MILFLHISLPKYFLPPNPSNFIPTHIPSKKSNQNRHANNKIILLRQKHT